MIRYSRIRVEPGRQKVLRVSCRFAMRFGLYRDALKAFFVGGDMKYQDYLVSSEWEKKRTKALEYAEHKCQICNSTEDLNVHHNTYTNLPAEHDRDLIVLCKHCHKNYHFVMEAADDCDFWPVVDMGGRLVQGRI
jgi:hypothetical protein